MSTCRIIGLVIVALAGCATVKVTRGVAVEVGRTRCNQSVAIWQTPDPNAVCDVKLTYTGCAACTAKISGRSSSNEPFSLRQTSSSTTDRVSSTAAARSLALECNAQNDFSADDGCTYSIDDVQCTAGSREASIQSLPAPLAVGCGEDKELWSSGAFDKRCNVTVALKGTPAGCQATVIGRTGGADQISNTGELTQLVTLVGVLSVRAQCGRGEGADPCMFAVKEVECK